MFAFLDRGAEGQRAEFGGGLRGSGEWGVNNDVGMSHQKGRAGGIHCA